MKKVFNENDMTTLGRPLYFDPDLYLDAVEAMIVADEVEFALEMIDRVPSFYRENPTERMKDIKATVYRILLTPHNYAQDPHESNYQIHWSDYKNHGQYWPRPSVVHNYIKDLGQDVNIHEYSPGDYSIPKFLSGSGLSFGYRGYTINEMALLKHKDLLEKHPLKEGALNIFLCFETIEHLWGPKSHLKHWIRAQGLNFHAVFISTPLNTLMGGLGDWRSRELGHIRTYNTKEFIAFCNEIAPGYQWTYLKADMQVGVGQVSPIGIRID